MTAPALSTKHPYYLFVATLALSPLAFGTVEPWSMAMIEALALSSLFLIALNKKNIHGRMFKVPGIFSLMLILLYMLLQCLPLPQWLLKLISPQAYSIYSETILISMPDAWLPISMNVGSTLEMFLYWSSCAAIYFLSVQCLARSKRLKNTALIIAMFAAIIAFIGIMGKIAGNDNVLWFRDNPWQSPHMGPYINRNHFAGLMAMLLPIAFSTFVAYRPRVSYLPFRESVKHALRHQSLHMHMLLALVSILVSVSILLSLSRAAILSTAIGVLIFGLLYFKRDHRVGLDILIFSSMIAVAYGWFGWTSIVSRFEHAFESNEISLSSRLTIWSDTTGIIKDFPFFGVGFGAFKDIYSSYRTLPGAAVLDHAHNDYLEMLAEGGIIGAALFAFFMATVIWQAVRGLMKRQDRYAICLTAGGISGIIAALLHSVVEFNLHIGSNALYLFAISGLTVSAANTRHLGSATKESYLARYKGDRMLRAVLAASGALLFILALKIATGAAAKHYHDNAFASPLPNANQAMFASKFAPLDAHHRRSAALAHMDHLDFETSSHEAAAALRLEPIDGRSLLLMAALEHINGSESRAEQSYKAAVKYSDRAHNAPLAYTSWLILQARPSDGLVATSAALQRDPRSASSYIALLLSRGIAADDVLHCLPKTRAYPYISMAEMLFKKHPEISLASMDSALLVIDQDNEALPSDYFTLYKLFLNAGNNDNALSTMRKASSVFPDIVAVRLALASQYERMGIAYRAMEEYSAALSLDSSSKQAREGIKRLSGITGVAK